MSGNPCSCASESTGRVLTQDALPDFVGAGQLVLAVDNVALTAGVPVPIGPIAVAPRMNRIFACLVIENYSVSPTTTVYLQGALVPEGPWSTISTYNVNAGGQSFLSPAATMQFPLWRLVFVLSSGVASAGKVLGYESRG